MIAICPAGEEHLLRGLRAGTLEVRAGDRARADLEAWLAEHDLRDAVGLLGAKPLILIHAEGDERIPSEFSAELYERAGEPAEADHCSRAATTAPPSTTRSCRAWRCGGSSGRCGRTTPGLISRRAPSR